MSDGQHNDRVRALAKMDKLLRGRSDKGAKRVEVERKQACITGQSRGAEDEKETLEQLLAVLTNGKPDEAVQLLQGRLAALAEEASQRRRRLMKLRAAAAESDSSESEDEEDTQATARAQAAADAVTASATMPAAQADGRTKQSLLAFVRSVLEPEPASQEADATQADATQTAHVRCEARACRLRAAGVPAALSHGGLLLDPSYWLGKAQSSGCTLNITENLQTPAPASAAADSAAGCGASLKDRGFMMADVSWPADIERSLDDLPAVMAALVQEGWPPAFCFVFDEPWRVLSSLVGWGEQLLGAGVRVEPSVFAWRLQRHKAGFPGSNFGMPHRDYSHQEACDDSGCRLLSVWIPLTDVSVDDGCMYVLGKDHDADFARPDAYAHLRCATKRTDDDAAAAGESVTELRFPIAGVRPLAPVVAKSVCAWAGNAVHFGAAASARSECPRMSIAVTLCAQRVDEVHGCAALLSASELLQLSLPQRLAFICRSLLSHSNWYGLNLPNLPH